MQSMGQIFDVEVALSQLYSQEEREVSLFLQKVLLEVFWPRGEK